MPAQHDRTKDQAMDPTSADDKDSGKSRVVRVDDEVTPALSGPEVEAAIKQAALDKEAADLAAKQAAEQAEADKLAADAQKAAEVAEDFGDDRAPRCPQCRERMEKYEGSNPHKQNTAFCPEHGRMPVYRNKVVAV